jgi:hypothetical protein
MSRQCNFPLTDRDHVAATSAGSGTHGCFFTRAEFPSLVRQVAGCIHVHARRRDKKHAKPAAERKSV